jgi:hypothetical protein
MARRQGDVKLVTDRSRYHYQIVSHELTVVPGRSYSMEYDVVVTSGTMSIGIVDLAADAWVANKTLTPNNPASGTIAFEAPSERLQIVLANANTDPARSVAYVKKIAVRGRRGAAAPAVATAPRPGPAAARRVLYELDPTAAAGTWSKGVDGASVTKVDGEMEVVSDVSRYHYQLVSGAVSVVRGTEYELQFDVEVTTGGMTIGVLDADANVWAVQRPLQAGHRGAVTVRFAAPSGSVRLIVANNNPEPARSSARISRLVLSRAATEPPERPATDDVGVSELYRLISASTAKTWSKGDANTTVSVQGSGLELFSGVSRYLYQIVSSPIEVIPGTEYSVDYDIELTSGLMAVGVLDAVANAWIVQHPLGRDAEARSTISFTAPANTVHLIVSNNNPEPARSSAWVKRLAMRGPSRDGPPASGETAPVAAARPEKIYGFEDHRVPAFSRTNLKAMVALARSSEAIALLAYHWRRDILIEPRQRRARHQAGRPSFILSLRHEEMTTAAYDRVIRSVAEETGSPLIEAPAFERFVSRLAAELAAHLSARMEQSKP